MDRRTFIVPIGALILVILALYSFLGGFNPVEISYRDVDSEYKMIGRSFEGKSNSKELGRIFESVRMLISEGLINGTVVLVNYNEGYDEKTGSVKYFIGVPVEGSPEDIPPNFEIRSYYLKKVIRAEINGHNLVMPSPEKVFDMAVEFAARDSLNLEDQYFEHYITERNIVIEYPVK